MKVVSRLVESSSQLSDSEGSVQLTVAPQESAAEKTLIFVGQLDQTGGKVSSTVTFQLQVSALPEVSEAMNSRVVTPTGKTDGEV